MKLNNQHFRELLRKATLRFLTERFRLALDPPAICRLMLAKKYTDMSFDEEDLEQALLYLKEEGFIAEVREPLATTIFYQATEWGIAANKRING